MKLLALLAAGGVLGVLAYRVQVHDLGQPGSRAAATVAVGWAFLAAGLVARWRRPANPLGLLLAATAFALLARQFRYSHDPVLFTVFFALGAVGYAMVGHCVFAYPFGRVRGRVERALVAAGYAVALTLPVAALLLHGLHGPLLGYSPLDPRRSVIAVARDDRAVELIEKTQIALFFGLLATLFLLVIVRNLVRATPRLRRILAPLLVAGVAIALRAIFECVVTFWPGARAFALGDLFWWQVAAVVALPIALLVGLLRERLARAAVGTLVLELEATPPGGLRDALARALGDPTLALAFRLPGADGYVDEAGQPVELPRRGDTRVVTPLEHDGEQLAVLVHDRSLVAEPQLLEAVAAAARLALQNARLHAELRVQLQQVAESRTRLATAADEERRRLERDLHDGAQQRLIAVALRLRTAQRQLGTSDPEVDRLLGQTVDELQVAVEELRELAHGIHPTILAEGGLAPALETLAARLPVDVSVEATPERFDPDVEATAYFVACEALTNVARHARASSASVSARRRDRTLVVEVADDGVGGAALDAGTGLRGLADRVEARGGGLRVDSRPGGGTRVVAEVPCAS